MDGHHYAEICSVFGINQEELETIQSHGLETKPKKYDLKKDRYQVFSSPWGVMRILGVHFGYKVPTMPMIGLVNTEKTPGFSWREKNMYLYFREEIDICVDMELIQL